MFKLINIAGDDLRLDDKGVSQMVTQSCRRAGVCVEGIAVRDDAVTLICSDNLDSEKSVYRFTPLGAEAGYEDIFAELRCRYDNNFRTIGAFFLADGCWTLTEKTLTE